MSFIGAFFIGFLAAFVFMFIIYMYQMNKVKTDTQEKVKNVMDNFQKDNMPKSDKEESKNEQDK